MKNTIEKSSDNTLDEISVYSITGLCIGIAGVVLTALSVIAGEIFFALHMVVFVSLVGIITSVVGITRRNNNPKNKQLASMGLVLGIIAFGATAIFSVAFHFDMWDMMEGGDNRYMESEECWF